MIAIKRTRNGGGVVCVALWIILMIVFCSSMTWAEGARVAAWDPGKGTNESRFKLDLKYLDQTAAWLKKAGIETARVTADQ